MCFNGSSSPSRAKSQEESCDAFFAHSSRRKPLDSKDLLYKDAAREFLEQSCPMSSQRARLKNHPGRTIISINIRILYLENAFLQKLTRRH